MNIIDAEILAKASYKHGEERQVPNYDIDKELTSDDRVVYRHQQTGKVTISFRGTDVKGFEYRGENPWASGMPFLPGSRKEFIQTGLQSLYHSRSFRDVGTDAMMVLGLEHLGTRFKHAEQVTARGIKKYGKENVSVVGHSLGGSQTMHVSQKYDIEGVAINPYVGEKKLSAFNTYPKLHIVHNWTDPVSVLSPFVHTGKLTTRYHSTYPGIHQHRLPHHTIPVFAGP